MGQPTREHAGMRRKGPWRSRISIAEDYPASGETFQIWRRPAWITIEAQTPGPNRIEHYEEDVRRGCTPRGHWRKRVELIGVLPVRKAYGEGRRQQHDGGSRKPNESIEEMRIGPGQSC